MICPNIWIRILSRTGARICFIRTTILHTFFVVKKEIIDKIGGFRSEYDGSQDYDLMFRCIENAESIKHIPMILYHWRMHGGSVAENPASKMYAYEAGKKAIEGHFERTGVKVKVEHMPLWGMYHVIYETTGNHWFLLLSQIKIIRRIWTRVFAHCLKRAVIVILKLLS